MNWNAVISTEPFGKSGGLFAHTERPAASSQQPVTSDYLFAAFNLRIIARSESAGTEGDAWMASIRSPCRMAIVPSATPVESAMVGHGDLPSVRCYASRRVTSVAGPSMV